MDDTDSTLSSSVGSNMGLMETEEGEEKWEDGKAVNNIDGDPLHTWPELSTGIK